MDCWEVLGIEAGSDKKTIKLAYAKLLKVHRPDDDPEGFQRLHNAYKHALKWVPIEYSTSSHTPWMDEDGRPVDASVTKALDAGSDDDAGMDIADPPALSPEDAALLDEIHQQEDRMGEDWEVLYTRVNALMKTKRLANDLEQWRFIEDLSSMSDLEFRKAAADKLFEAVSSVNSAALQEKHLYIQRPVINYLNGLFAWDKKWQEYEYEFTRDKLDAVFPYLAEADYPSRGKKVRRELYYYRRGAAFAIDLVIVFVVSLLLNAIVGLVDEETATLAIFWWLVIYVCLLIPLQESSKHQATIGKRVMGLRVITAKGHRLHFLHALWRSLVTVVCCIGFKVVVFINIILSWWRAEILQDTLTRSYVMLNSGR